MGTHALEAERGGKGGEIEQRGDLVEKQHRFGDAQRVAADDRQPILGREGDGGARRAQRLVARHDRAIELGGAGRPISGRRDGPSASDRPHRSSRADGTQGWTPRVSRRARLDHRQRGAGAAAREAIGAQQQGGAHRLRGRKGPTATARPTRMRVWKARRSALSSASRHWRESDGQPIDRLALARASSTTAREATTRAATPGRA